MDLTKIADEYGMGGLAVAIAVAALVYLIPSSIASLRRHPQSGPITVINILLGWSLVGWVAALAWAVSSTGKPRPTGYRPPHLR